jgi:hypothetical protein
LNFTAISRIPTEPLLNQVQTLHPSAWPAREELTPVGAGPSRFAEHNDQRHVARRAGYPVQRLGQ